MVSVMIIVIMRIFSMFCLCMESTSPFTNSYTILIMTIWILATFCGFIHPDLSFESYYVEVKGGMEDSNEGLYFQGIFDSGSSEEKESDETD